MSMQIPIPVKFYADLPRPKDETTPSEISYILATRAFQFCYLATIRLHNLSLVYTHDKG